MINLMEIAISKYIVHLMVPCFFMVSGYLFFKKITFNISTYTAKVQSRFHSIAMPYIYWNILYLLFLLSMKMLGVIFHGNDVRGIVLFLEEHGWIKLLWNSQILSSTSVLGKEIYHYFPINAPLWFLRDLFVVVLFSPLIFWLIKRWCFVYMMILSMVWYTNVLPAISGLSYGALFFFSIGSIFSIRNYNIVEFSQRYKSITICCSLLLFVGLMTLVIKEEILFPLFKLSGAFLIIYLGSRFSNGRVATFLENMEGFSMFVFVAQYFFLSICGSIVSSLLPPENLFNETISYFFKPFFIVGIMYIVYYCIQREFPVATSKLLGKRKL